ncbi:MAG: hypothetical protein L3J45_09320 [Flavobacteriaceae bacterium]|nr:hypothetical protein [Flavobacteriaceae bacterium]
MKKFWVLFSLFIVPLLFYLFLASGINNFSKLPIVTSQVNDITAFKTSDKESLSLKSKISVICFFGKNLLTHKTNALNLNEKIYKHFYQYNDFQMIALLPQGVATDVAQLKKELGYTTNLENWHFLYGQAADLNTFYNALQSHTTLDSLNYSPLVFIIDKDLNLRGRADDEDAPKGILYGYNATTVSPIHKKMVDDIKVLLVEYRRATKKKRNNK